MGISEFIQFVFLSFALYFNAIEIRRFIQTHTDTDTVAPKEQRNETKYEKRANTHAHTHTRTSGWIGGPDKAVVKHK